MIDQTTGEFTSVWGPKNIFTTGFAPDGTLYTHGGAGQYLAKYDLLAETGGTYGNKLPLTWHGGILGGIAIDSSENAITGTNYNHLYSVDLSDGSHLTDLGLLTGMPMGLRTVDYDSSGRLIAFVDTGIYSINLSTMKATEIMPLTVPTGYQGRGFAIANVPEPSTIALLIGGLSAGGLFWRRRK